MSRAGGVGQHRAPAQGIILLLDGQVVGLDSGAPVQVVIRVGLVIGWAAGVVLVPGPPPCIIVPSGRLVERVGAGLRSVGSIVVDLPCVPPAIDHAVQVVGAVIAIVGRHVAGGRCCPHSIAGERLNVDIGQDPDGLVGLIVERDGHGAIQEVVLSAGRCGPRSRCVRAWSRGCRRHSGKPQPHATHERKCKPHPC